MEGIEPSASRFRAGVSTSDLHPGNAGVAAESGGVEPPFRQSKSLVQSHRLLPTRLVPPPGIEPDPPALRAGARTTYARAASWGRWPERPASSISSVISVLARARTRVEPRAKPRAPSRPGPRIRTWIERFRAARPAVGPARKRVLTSPARKGGASRNRTWLAHSERRIYGPPRIHTGLEPRILSSHEKKPPGFPGGSTSSQTLRLRGWSLLRKGTALRGKAAVDTWLSVTVHGIRIRQPRPSLMGARFDRIRFRCRLHSDSRCFAGPPSGVEYIASSGL